jgi:hypothetical protein
VDAHIGLEVFDTKLQRIPVLSQYGYGLDIFGTALVPSPLAISLCVDRHSAAA